MENKFFNGYAIVVGVGNDLPQTVDDAKTIYDLLVNPGVCAYPKNNVKLLIDHGATRQAIMDGLNWLVDSVNREVVASTAVVYFSGHGGAGPDYFLVPYDLMTDGYSRVILGSEFSSKLKEIEADRLLVLLDTCHAGGIANLKTASGHDCIKSPVTVEVLQELAKGSGRVVIASCHADETSEILSGEPLSVFTSALKDAFVGRGSFEQDGYVRVLDMATYVCRMVPNRTSDRQNPIIKIADLESNYAVAYYAGGGKGGSALHNHPSSEALVRQLKNCRYNLLLIEERISEYVVSTEVPLQLIKEKRDLKARIQAFENVMTGSENKPLQRFPELSNELCSHDNLWGYLNQIIQNFELWSDLYTPLSFSAKPLAVEMQALQLPFHFKTDEDIEETDLLKIVCPYRKLVITGDPGAGKTTALSYLNMIFARNAFKSVDFDGSKIPILIKLYQYQGDIYALIAASLKALGLNANPNSLMKALGKGGFILLFDGLNEIPLPMYRQAVESFHSMHERFTNNKYIYTSRSYNYNDELAIPIVKINLLDPESIIEFADRYLDYFKETSVTGKDFFNRLDSKIKEVVRNPLMLLMLLKIYISSDKDNRHIPKNRSLVYEEFVSQTLNNWETVEGRIERGNRFTYDQKIKALSEIAFYMQNAQIVSSAKNDVLAFVRTLSDFSSYEEALLEELFSNRMLEINNGTVAFSHQSFQEFFAAKSLRLDFLTGVDISYTFDTPGWEETIILLSGLIDNSSVLVFDHIMDKNLYLAGEAIYEAKTVDHPVKIAVVQVLYEKLLDPFLRTREISNEIINKIDPDRELYKFIAGIGEKYNEGELMRMLCAQDWFEKLTGIIGVTKKYCRKAVDRLIDIISDNTDKPAIRWRASNALRQLPRDIDAVDRLMRLCATDDEQIKWPCVHALGVMAIDRENEPLVDPASIDAIVDFLHELCISEPNKNIRYGTVRVLAELGGDKATAFLCEMIRHDQGKEVRERAAAGLGILRSATAADALLSAFSDAQWEVRREAIRSFGMLDFEAVSNIPEELMAAARDKDWRVCLAAIKTLERLKIPGKKEILLLLTQNSNDKIRSAANEAILTI